MSFDPPRDDHPESDSKEAEAKTSALGNILHMISKNKPALRLVKTIGDTSAKIIPFRKPLALIVGGFALSAYALI